MDWLVAALIGGLAYWVGQIIGFRHGVGFGRAEAIVQRRLAELRGNREP